MVYAYKTVNSNFNVQLFSGAICIVKPMSNSDSLIDKTKILMTKGSLKG